MNKEKEVEISDIETPAEKKKRIRISRELNEERIKEDEDEKYLLMSELRKRNKKSSGEIYQEYAMAILDKILNSERIDVILFANGKSEEGKKHRDVVCYSVSNMAKELTKKQIELYPN